MRDCVESLLRRVSRVGNTGKKQELFAGQKLAGWNENPEGRYTCIILKTAERPWHFLRRAPGANPSPAERSSEDPWDFVCFIVGVCCW